MKCLWLATFLPAVLFSASTAASLARSFQDSGLDVDAAFRVRDLSFQKDDIRFYLTEGRIIFSKPVEGKRFAAFFTTDVDGGDGEVILFPPHKSERLALSSFAKTPNLNEHIKTALFLFTDGTGEQLLQRFQSSQKLEPEIALMLDQSYSPVLRNVAGSYVTRLVQDFLSPGQESQGLFYAVAHGSTLGLFDIVYDPLAREQILVGQMNVRDGQHYFDAWTSFQARPFRTGVKAPPSPPVRVSDIAIDATVAADLSLKATTKLTLTATARTGRALQFELSRRMRVTEAKFDGVPVEVFNREAMRANLTRATSENDVFLVVLPEPIEPGKSHAFEFQHEGNVIMPAGNGVYFVAARSSWYPHRESVFARYDLTFRYPKNFDLVATGTLVDQRTDGDQKIARRRTSQPVRFAGFNIGDYENVSLKQSGLEIAVYANRTVEQALMPRTTELVLVPRVAGTRGAGTRNQELATMPVIPSTPNPKARLHEIAGEISSVMTFLASQLGPPPIETLTVSPIPGTFGQGFAGLIYLSTLSYIPASQRPASLGKGIQDTFFSEILLTHEAAHQWFGNLVTSNSYQDDWIMEGMANYTALLMLERRKGRKALETVLDHYRDELLTELESGRVADSVGPIIWGNRLNTSVTPRASRAILYGKGSWIIHMLRVRMGDAAFLKFLGEIVRKFRYQGLTTEQLRQVASGFLPAGADDRNLEAFFEQWVYGTGIPTLKLKYTVSGKGPVQRLHATVLQTNVPEDFSALVPVEVQLAGKKAVTKWVRTSSEPVTFSMDVTRGNLKVVLDPYRGVLTGR